MSKMLYLIRGLPGSGKSTFAKELQNGTNSMHLEADMWHMEEVPDEDGNFDGHTEYIWRPERVGFAHKECQRMCKVYMDKGLSVIVSNTFTTAKEMEPYLALAQEFGYRVTSLVVENRHGGVNIHDVPQATLDKMRNRFTIKL